MNWYPGLGFTLPHILPWLPSSSASSNVPAWQQSVVQTISKLREDTPSIYMDGIYKDDEKFPNYEIRYAHILTLLVKLVCTYARLILDNTNSEIREISVAYDYSKTFS